MKAREVMTIEQKRKYLKQYKKSVYKIKALKKELAILEADDLMSGIDYSKDKIQTSPANDAMVNHIIKKDDIRNLILDEQSKAEEICLNIITAISTVGDDMQQCILHRRYILFETWESIAAEINYSIQWVYLTHAEALADMQLNVQRELEY